MRADPFLRSPACNFLKILESKGKKKRKRKRKKKKTSFIGFILRAEVVWRLETVRFLNDREIAARGWLGKRFSDKGRRAGYSRSESKTREDGKNVS